MNYDEDLITPAQHTKYRDTVGVHHAPSRTRTVLFENFNADEDSKHEAHDIDQDKTDDIGHHGRSQTQSDNSIGSLLWPYMMSSCLTDLMGSPFPSRMNGLPPCRKIYYLLEHRSPPCKDERICVSRHNPRNLVPLSVSLDTILYGNPLR